MRRRRTPKNIARRENVGHPSIIRIGMLLGNFFSPFFETKKIKAKKIGKKLHLIFFNEIKIGKKLHLIFFRNKGPFRESGS